MCYSAQIEAEWKVYVRVVGLENALSLPAFFRKYWERIDDSAIKIPKALDSWFKDDPDIMQAITTWTANETSKLENEIFKQKRRLADAERILQTKTTKKAVEDQRISTQKIEWAKNKLSDLRRNTTTPADERIYPGWYAPVIVVEDGKKVIKPMRYQCRIPRVPATYDRKFPGTYNARRDNLGGCWKDLFGYRHGIMIASAFFENVSRHTMEHRELAPHEKEENVILKFQPNTGEDMLVACLWAHWKDAEDELLSFAAITDEPPAEVRDAGHDRCIIPIKPEHIDAWLNPDANNLEALQAILDGRARPYYEHRMAA
jgi:putative SOS response-associated peptidase YedK